MTASAGSRERFQEKEASTQHCLPPISELISDISTEYRTPASPPSTQPSTDFLSSRLVPSRAHGKPDNQAYSQSPRSTPSSTERQTPLRKSPRVSSNERVGLPPLSEQSTYAHAPAPASVHGTRSSYTLSPFPQERIASCPTSPCHSPLHKFSLSLERQYMNYIGDMSVGTRPLSEATTHSEPRSYKEHIFQLEQYAKTLVRFAELYNHTIQDQHSPHPIPERLPTKQQVTNMISNHMLQLNTLEYLRETVQPPMRNPRAVDAPKRQSTSKDKQDAPILGHNRTGYCTVPQSEAQRPHDIPPKFCHSCSRVDTPEWRRGPDGSRTLCNACGLHYAKLRRKRQLKQKHSA